MNRTRSTFFAAALAAVSLTGMGTLAGCEKEGPMERAGEEADKAVEETGEAIEKAGDEIKDVTKNP